MKILVAMSGGIDSSVVAHLLKEKGHDIVGVRFTLWMDPLAPPLAQILPSKCCNAQTAARTDAVCWKLGIPLHILNWEDEFKREVVDPFLEGYRKGITPNPCIRCNRTIKFGKLLELADKLGCEKLATGHYARITREIRKKTQHFHLFEAIDKHKDQSYYLYGLNQKQLSRSMFPLGTMLKEDVYRLAEKFFVPFERISYRESQDLCFFPEKEPREFLKRHLKEELQPGPIIRRHDGKTIGTHKGIPLYTIGQRKIGIGGNRIPLEVVQKDYSCNTIFVDNKGSNEIKELKIRSVRWLPQKPCENKWHLFGCRTRSHSPKFSGQFRHEDTHGTFRFDSPIPLQAPGQHLVLYHGEEVIGGGEII